VILRPRGRGWQLFLDHRQLAVDVKKQLTGKNFKNDFGKSATKTVRLAWSFTGRERRTGLCTVTKWSRAFLCICKSIQGSWLRRAATIVLSWKREAKQRARSALTTAYEGQRVHRAKSRTNNVLKVVVPNLFPIEYRLCVRYCDRVPPCSRKTHSTKYYSVISSENYTWHNSDTHKMAMRSIMVVAEKQ